MQINYNNPSTMRMLMSLIGKGGDSVGSTLDRLRALTRMNSDEPPWQPAYSQDIATALSLSDKLAGTGGLRDYMDTSRLLFTGGKQPEEFSALPGGAQSFPSLWVTPPPPQPIDVAKEWLGQTDRPHAFDRHHQRHMNPWDFDPRMIDWLASGNLPPDMTTKQSWIWPPRMPRGD